MWGAHLPSFCIEALAFSALSSYFDPIPIVYARIRARLNTISLHAMVNFLGFIISSGTSICLDHNAVAQLHVPQKHIRGNYTIPYYSQTRDLLITTQSAMGNLRWGLPNAHPRVVTVGFSRHPKQKSIYLLH